MTPPRRQRRRQAATGLVAVALTTAGVAYGVHRLRPAEPTVPACIGGDAHIDYYPELSAKWAIGWSDRLSKPGDPNTVVLAPPPERQEWHYRRIMALPGRGRGTVEGTVRRPDAIDETTSHYKDQAEHSWHRSVVVGDLAWNASRVLGGWVNCRTKGDPVAPAGEFGFTYDPEGRGYDGTCGGECVYHLWPGARVPFTASRAQVVAGETLTTYEIDQRVGEGHLKDPSRLRATMTLDDARRLRAAKVWDTRTGQIYTTFEAGPAPADTRITDPSGQPPFPDTPSPLPTDLGTMPADAPPAA